MSDELRKILTRIGDEYQEHISDKGRNYLEVSIGKQAEKMGYSRIPERYRDVHAVVPLKKSVRGMKVRIDGRTFVNYAQFDSGIVVPEYVAREAGLPYKTYHANDSMICNFS